MSASKSVVIPVPVCPALATGVPGRTCRSVVEAKRGSLEIEFGVSLPVAVVQAARVNLSVPVVPNPPVWPTKALAPLTKKSL